jgi:hypothetical protein
MRGAKPPFPQYTFMAWCSTEEKAQEKLYVSITLHIQFEEEKKNSHYKICYQQI